MVVIMPRFLAATVAAAASIFLFATPLSAVAVQPRAGPINNWVTVDANGQAHTIFPSVTSKNGGLSTISAAPYSLTGTVYTITNGDGQKATSTGKPPPPRATNAQGAGYFAVCNNAVGQDGPFCEPRRGSQLHSRRTYYITWDATYFGQDDAVVQVKGFQISATSGEQLATTPVFITGTMPGKQGYYVWTIDDKYLNGNTYTNVSIHLSYPDRETGEENDVPGPKFSILEAVPDPPAKSGGGTNKLAIALPIVFVLLAILGVGGFFFYRHRRRNGQSGLGIKRSSSGYGVRKAHSQRVGTQKGDVNIQLGERQSPTSPSSPPGRNVFQEELQRQERERQ